MWRWLVVVAVTGCNQLYGLDATKQRDAATFPDGDGDGIPDLEDNCPARANPTQDDADGDRRGDVCDDCPLVTNPPGDDKDADGLGDACDPHPEARGDCLLVVDGFRDPAAFASHWQVNGMGTAVPEPGQLVMTPSAMTSAVRITDASTTGLLADVMVLGRAATMKVDVFVTALSSVRDDSTYYGCQLNPPIITAQGPGLQTATGTGLVPVEMVGDRFLIRLATLATASAVEVVCRIDYGVSVGTQNTTDRQLVMGPSGVRVSGRAATIDAIAISVFRPDQPCTTEYR